MKTFSLIVITTLFIAACGNKGQLYLPDAEKEKMTQEKKSKY